MDDKFAGANLDARSAPAGRGPGWPESTHRVRQNRRRRFWTTRTRRSGAKRRTSGRPRPRAISPSPPLSVPWNSTEGHGSQKKPRKTLILGHRLATLRLQRAPDFHGKPGFFWGTFWGYRQSLPLPTFNGFQRLSREHESLSPLDFWLSYFFNVLLQLNPLIYGL